MPTRAWQVQLGQRSEVAKRPSVVNARANQRQLLQAAAAQVQDLGNSQNREGK